MAQRFILFLNQTYINTIEELVSIVSNQFGREEFRHELLASYRDHLLERWFEQSGKRLNLNCGHTIAEVNDNQLLKLLFKAITGTTCETDLSSNFANLGEFVRCEVDDKQFIPSNRVIQLSREDEVGEIQLRFVFKSYKVDNNNIEFALYEGETRIETSMADWKEMFAEKEYSFIVTIKYDLSTESERVFSLLEGNKNEICKVVLPVLDKVNRIVDGVSYCFNYIPKLHCWAVKFTSAKNADFQKAHSLCFCNRKLGLYLPSEKDARIILTSKMKNTIHSFWTCTQKIASIDQGKVYFEDTGGVKGNVWLLSKSLPANKDISEPAQLENTIEIYIENRICIFNKVKDLWVFLLKKRVLLYHIPEEEKLAQKLSKTYAMNIRIPNILDILSILKSKNTDLYKYLFSEGIWCSESSTKHVAYSLKKPIKDRLKKNPDFCKMLSDLNMFSLNQEELIDRLFEKNDFGPSNVVFVIDGNNNK